MRGPCLLTRTRKYAPLFAAIVYAFFFHATGVRISANCTGCGGSSSSECADIKCEDGKASVKVEINREGVNQLNGDERIWEYTFTVDGQEIAREEFSNNDESDFIESFCVAKDKEIIVKIERKGGSGSAVPPNSDDCCGGIITEGSSGSGTSSDYPPETATDCVSDTEDDQSYGPALLKVTYCAPCGDPGEKLFSEGTDRFIVDGSNGGGTAGTSEGKNGSVDFRVNLGRNGKGERVQLIIRADTIAGALNPANVSYPSIVSVYELEIWNWFNYELAAEDVDGFSGVQVKSARQYLYRFFGPEGYKDLFSRMGIQSVPRGSGNLGPATDGNLGSPAGYYAVPTANDGAVTQYLSVPLIEPMLDLIGGDVEFVPRATLVGGYADGVKYEEISARPGSIVSGTYDPKSGGTEDDSLDDFVRAHLYNKAVPFGYPADSSVLQSGGVWTIVADPEDALNPPTQITNAPLQSTFSSFAAAPFPTTGRGATYTVRNISALQPGGNGHVPHKIGGVDAGEITLGPDVCVKVTTQTGGYVIDAYWRSQVTSNLDSGTVGTPAGVSPFATWTVSNGGNVSGNEVLISEVRGGVETESYRWTKDDDNWSMVHAKGNRKLTESKEYGPDGGMKHTTKVEDLDELRVVSFHQDEYDSDGRLVISRDGADAQIGDGVQEVTNYYHNGSFTERIGMTRGRYFEIYKKVEDPVPLAGGTIPAGEYDVIIRPWGNLAYSQDLTHNQGSVTMTRSEGGVETTYELVNGTLMTETIVTTTTRMMGEQDEEEAYDDEWLSYRLATERIPVRRVTTNRRALALPTVVEKTVQETFISGAPASLVGLPAMVRRPDGRVTVYHHYPKGSYDFGADNFLQRGGLKRDRMTYEVTYDGSVFPMVKRPYKDESYRVITDSEGREVSRRLLVWNAAGELEGVQTTRTSYDLDGNIVSRMVGNVQTLHTVTTGGGRTVTDETGDYTTETNLDVFGRAQTVTRRGYPEANELPEVPARETNYRFDAMGRVRREWRGMKASESTYDSRGRLNTSTEGLLSEDQIYGARTTTYSRSADGSVETMTSPSGLSGVTRITTTLADGHVASIGGTAGPSQTFSRYVNGSGFPLASLLPAWLPASGYIVECAKTDGEESSIRIVDGFGRTLGDYVFAFDTNGQLNGSWRRYVYDSTGRVTAEYLGSTLVRTMNYADGVETIQASPNPDQVHTSSTIYQADGGAWWKVTATEAGIHRERVFDGIHESQFTDTASAVTTRTSSASAGVVTEESYTPGVTNPTITKSRGGLMQFIQTPGGATTVFGYDDFGRQISVFAPGGITSTTLYDGIYGQPSQIVTSGSTIGTNASTTTLITYASPGDPAPGAVITKTVDGRATYYAYNDDGSLRATWGADYPQRYEYQSGRLVKLHTYREQGNGEPTGEGDKTTWVYKYGLLRSKTDAAGGVVSYSYTPEGRLHTRRWARGIDTTYAYDLAGQMISVSYNDGTTNPVSYGYDEKGRLISASAGESFMNRSWFGLTHMNENGLIAEEYYTDFSRVMRPDGQVASMLAQIYSPTKMTTLTGLLAGYDDATGLLTHSTLFDVTMNGNNGTYLPASYSASSFFRTPDTNLINEVSHYAVNGAANPPIPTGLVLKRSHIRDGIGRTKRMETGVLNGALTNFHEYTYQNGLRTAAQTERGDWTYGYNARAEVTGGTKKIGNAVVPGYSFGYLFDTIGNRISHTVNGNTTSYNATNLNQYLDRSNPGVIDVRAELALPSNHTPSSASVELNGTTYNAGPFVSGKFAKSVPVDNTSARFDTLQISATATTGNQELQVSETRKALVPPAAEEFTHDADGNLIGDALHTYTYDGENRLIAIERRDNTWPGNVIPEGLEWGRIVFQYDYMGRRVRKQVYATDKSTVLRKNWFIYDGWNPMSEVEEHLSGPNAGVTVTRNYQWGPDLSGTHGGAGGVGGLLAVHVRQTPLPTGQTESFKRLVPSYDGNGNIVAYLDGNTGAIAQEEEYGPFGESLRASANSLLRSPIGWSSEYADQETGFVYYGYRFYKPDVGQWINRDPAEEYGGLNLHAFVSNSPIGRHDILGLAANPDCWCERVKSVRFERRVFFPPSAVAQTYGFNLEMVVELDYVRCQQQMPFEQRQAKFHYYERTDDPTPIAIAQLQAEANKTYDAGRLAKGVSFTIDPWHDREFAKKGTAPQGEHDIVRIKDQPAWESKDKRPHYLEITLAVDNPPCAKAAARGRKASWTGWWHGINNPRFPQPYSEKLHTNDTAY